MMNSDLRSFLDGTGGSWNADEGGEEGILFLKVLSFSMHALQLP